jgi:hypothetical protein
MDCPKLRHILSDAAANRTAFQKYLEVSQQWIQAQQTLDPDSPEYLEVFCEITQAQAVWEAIVRRYESQFLTQK